MIKTQRIIAGIKIRPHILTRVKNLGTIESYVLIAKTGIKQDLRFFRQLHFVNRGKQVIEVIVGRVKPKPEINKLDTEPFHEN
jgi:hypothetical protein